MSLLEKIKAHPACAECYEDASNRTYQHAGKAVAGRRRWYQQKDWWCYLRAGWTNPELGCSVIHEPTLTEVWRQLRKCYKKQESTRTTASTARQ